MIKKIKCFFGFHKYEITSFIMPYKKECVNCKRKMIFVGYDLWIKVSQK